MKRVIFSKLFLNRKRTDKGLKSAFGFALAIVAPAILISLVVVGYAHSKGEKARAQLELTKTELERTETENVELRKRIARIISNKENLEAEIVAWRKAAEPAMDLYHRQLSYTGRGKVDLALEGTPKDLALALRPCEWKRLGFGCSRRGENVPIYIGVLNSHPMPIE